MTKKLMSFAAATLFATVGAVFAEPLGVIDDRGEPVTLPAPATKVAAVSLFGADLATALGVDVVATTYLSKGKLPTFLAEDLKEAQQLGSRSSPNMEVLTKAEPDIILALRRYTEASTDEFNEIAPYVGFHAESFADSLAAVNVGSYLLGMHDQGKALNEQFTDDLYTIEAELPDDHKPESFLLLWGSGEAPWAYYDAYATVSFLNALGLYNPLGSNPTPHDRNNFAYQMNLEQMLQIDPDHIVVFDRGPDEPFLTNPIWNELTAVKENKVHFVGDHWMASHGPIARQLVVQEAAHMFYPDLFGPTSVEKVKAHLNSALN